MIDKSKYTHYASMYLVPCYFNIDTFDISGRGTISDFFLEYYAIPFAGMIEWACSCIDMFHEAEFPITLKGKIE